MYMYISYFLSEEVNRKNTKPKEKNVKQHPHTSLSHSHIHTPGVLQSVVRASPYPCPLSTPFSTSNT